MTESIQKKPLKKGSLVVLDREKYANSVEYTPPLSDLIVAELSHLEPGYLRHDELCG